MEPTGLKTYTADEVAKICQCYPLTIRKYIKDGYLRAVKFGRAYVIKESDLDDFMHQIENMQLQASLQRESEKKCHYINEKTEFGITALHYRAVNEFAEVLGLKTEN
ncbi:helix-turn-helix domain-containing protein [Snodgrassella alvi]|uniref:Helix-turn-helix domain-containing protein n=1 Tax=Snodgrassella alvi TaxID=1196083 RepID=A0ABD7Z2I4_9NEIS|nr:helix-turn-helix domain-containing protein [Snodgrassella alvi]PIT43870.1 hypothetical protein BHC45_09250 [Snodgrassella alvi]PIT67595.1 hypothetical protein BHC52_03960 [Snodgrassella alvi]UOO99336.1 helix-turn-helix domain-containing protein [Snodgrassella alvi wkB2]WLS98799.1 helix-turn-helix domain-containing protein [Snodgrassella alvi]